MRIIEENNAFQMHTFEWLITILIPVAQHISTKLYLRSNPCCIQPWRIVNSIFTRLINR